MRITEQMNKKLRTLAQAVDLAAEWAIWGASKPCSCWSFKPTIYWAKATFFTTLFIINQFLLASTICFEIKVNHQLVSFVISSRSFPRRECSNDSNSSFIRCFLESWIGLSNRICNGLILHHDVIVALNPFCPYGSESSHKRWMKTLNGFVSPFIMNTICEDLPDLQNMNFEFSTKLLDWKFISSNTNISWEHYTMRRADLIELSYFQRRMLPTPFIPFTSSAIKVSRLTLSSGLKRTCRSSFWSWITTKLLHWMSLHSRLYQWDLPNEVDLQIQWSLGQALIQQRSS